jgi:hypothetical protein
MKLRDVDAALVAANPVGRERADGLLLAASERQYLEAIREEPLPVAASSSSSAGNGGDRRAGSREGARPRVALAALLCLLFTASAFTTPGRAFTGWVGEKIGFGEVGGPPSLRQLRATWGQGTGAERQPAYVLHVGPVPGGGRYEFITYEPRAPAGKHWDVEGPCFELDFTQERSMVSQGCGVLAKGSDLYSLGAGGNYDPDQELHYVAGRASAAVSSVQARFEGRPAAVELVSVPEELVRRLHLGRPFKFFIAFFEHASRGGTATVTARDATGRVLGRSSSELPDVRLMYEPMCRELRARKHANAAALEDCDQVLGPSPGTAVDLD